MFVVLTEVDHLKAETCQEWHSVNKLVLIINVCISQFLCGNTVHVLIVDDTGVVINIKGEVHSVLVG
jgi:hypothetical protein